MLHELKIDDFKSISLDCIYARYPSIYKAAVHASTGHLHITLTQLSITSFYEICSTNGRHFVSLNPSIGNWKYIFNVFMDSVDDYARQWGKREKKYVDILTEWEKSLMQIRIKQTKWVNGHFNP